MSEYWKSVPRKFCEFCKCWITDNKPSVDFHERGKRHQENVEIKLKEVRKKSVQDAKDKQSMDTEMEKLEKAALEAFKKDLKNNPELAAQYGVSLEKKPESATSAEGAPSQPASSIDKEEKKAKKRKKEKREWYEAKSPQGYSYYWSTKTGESTWTAPEEFVSIAEQTEKEKVTKVKEKEEKPESKPSASVQDSSHTASVSQPSGPTGFGAWEVIKEEQQPQMFEENSAAPVPEEIPLPNAITSEVSEQPLDKGSKPKFKERTVSSLGSSSNVTFKKRKVAAGARNVRTRDADE